MKKLKNRLVPIMKLNQYAEDPSVLDDMDHAKIIDDLIFEMLKRDIRPVLDFIGIEKIHPYWFVIALIKYSIKMKNDINKLIGVVNLNEDQLKLLNIVIKECRRNGSSILNGIQVSTLPDVYGDD